MNHITINEDLSKLLLSENGCKYSDLSDNVINFNVMGSNKMINVLHLNIRSYMKNSDNLLLLLNEFQEQGVVIHIIGICETFLTEKSSLVANMANYQCIHKCQKDKIGGGVSILIHNSVKLLCLIESPFNDLFESVIAELGYRGNVLGFCEFYCPPNTNDLVFKESLQRVLGDLNTYQTAFICSDQNYDLLKASSHRPTSDMIEQLLESEFAPAILKPYHVTYTTSSLIDNIFVKSRRLLKHFSYVLLDAMSDHYPCLLSLPLKCDVEGEIILEKRRLSDEAIQKIQQDLLFYPWDDLSEIPVNTSYPYLVNVITKMLDKHAPIKKVIIKSSEKFREPWMTLSIKKCNQKSRKLCKLAKNSKLRKDYDRFKQYRNALNRIKLSEKHQHYKDLF